ncbi:ABC transporter permease [Lapidilactobacillus luobeiensis]|uniref:ABC transporter permease n=1 Tax=Lapidilactobacillus luobeiensis TaxID=2950371 RepID=UPI0021C4C66F|nr:ABC transporter permease [Lapidilactobacillus luobeiensis]
MNFLKRAWLNLIAKKGRSILLILVTSAIMLFVLAGLLIKNAANTATENAKKSVGATLTLSANREAAFKKMRASASSQSDATATDSSSSESTTKPQLTMAAVKLSDVKQIAALANVKSYNVTATTSVNAQGFDAITSTTSVMQGGGSASSDSTSDSGNAGPGGKGGFANENSGDITVTGVSATSDATNFTDGSYKITKGRGILASDAGTNNVVIEKELAAQNDLSVGDTIKVESTDGATTYQLKIVGIYKASSAASNMQMGPGASDPSNSVYTSYTLANKIKGSKYKNTADSVTFTISDPAKVNSVKKAGNKLINTTTYSLSANDANYQSVKSSMNNVKSFADKIVWLVAIAGTVILALIVILMIRERRYEIGVLLSLGEARWKIIAQFFAEMLVVLLVSIGIAGAGGQFVGDKLGDQLVAQQTSSQTSTSNSNQQGQDGPGGQMGGAGGPGGNMSKQQATPTKTELNVQVTAADLGELGGLGLAIVFVSITIASVGILRLQPRKVLIE